MSAMARAECGGLRFGGARLPGAMSYEAMRPSQWGVDDDKLAAFKLFSSCMAFPRLTNLLIGSLLLVRFLSSGVSCEADDRLSKKHRQLELIRAIDGVLDRLIEALRRIPTGETCQMCLVGYAQRTDMSVASVVAYPVGWTELVLKWLERDEADLPARFPRRASSGLSSDACGRRVLSHLP